MENKELINAISQIKISPEIINKLIAKRTIDFKLIHETMNAFSNSFSEISKAFSNLNVKDWEEFYSEFGWMETFPIPFASELKQILNAKGKTAVWEEICSMLDGEEAKKYFNEQYSKLQFILPRLKIINKAFEHHEKQDYISSIPLFLSQIEGILWDLAVYHKLMKQGEEFKINPLGDYVLDSKNSKIRWHSGALFIELFGKDSKFSTEGHKNIYSKEFRHPIMHGRDINYDKKEREAHLIMFLFVLLDKVKEEVR